MEITKQLAVFLDNRPGALSRGCEAFEEKGINIHALTTVTPLTTASCAYVDDTIGYMVTGRKRRHGSGG